MPGDGLYEENIKREGTENQWDGDGKDGEKRTEQDAIMAEANVAAVA